MITIYKFKLERNEFQSIEIQEGAKLLSVGLDLQGKICIWAQVDTGAKMTIRKIRMYGIYGTGDTMHALYEDKNVVYKFLGTVNYLGYMWHVYYERSTDEILREALGNSF